MRPKFVAAPENVKTETQQTFVDRFAPGFITLGIYTPLWKHIIIIAHNNCMSCPSIWATLSTAH